MRTIFLASLGLAAIAMAETAAAETLKVAVAQRGFWNSAFIDVGLKQGYFKELGLDIEILYTEGGASTLTPVITGSIDIAMTNGILTSAGQCRRSCCSSCPTASSHHRARQRRSGAGAADHSRQRGQCQCAQRAPRPLRPLPPALS